MERMHTIETYRTLPEIFEQYGLIPDEDIISKILDMLKISFDYDGTLSTERGKNLAARTIQAGNEVYIITARHKADGAPVYAAADKLGIPADRVIFTEGRDKYETVAALGINLHYDNNKDQVDKINKLTNSASILF